MKLKSLHVSIRVSNRSMQSQNIIVKKFNCFKYDFSTIIFVACDNKEEYQPVKWILILSKGLVGTHRGRIPLTSTTKMNHLLVPTIIMGRGS